MPIVDRGALSRNAAVDANANPRVRAAMDALIDGAMQGDFDMRGYFEREEMDRKQMEYAENMRRKQEAEEKAAYPYKDVSIKSGWHEPPPQPSVSSDWARGAARNMNVPLEPRTVDTLLERALKELAASQDWLERIEERLGLGAVANNAREVDGGPFMNLVDSVADRSADVASRIQAVARRLFYGVGDE
jgi:hypothetical protein